VGKQEINLPQLNIYTDGACLGNPGPGGYGVILEFNGQTIKKSGGFRRTTNNRMELMGPIIGLESLKKKCRVTVYSDSRYVVDAFEKGWARRWKENGWKRNSKDAALNPDLWGRLLRLCAQHEVEFQWVRGHNGHAENEECDGLSNQAAQGKDLEIDAGYENVSGRLI